MRARVCEERTCGFTIECVEMQRGGCEEFRIYSWYRELSFSPIFEDDKFYYSVLTIIKQII